ncbi:MAG: ADP-ribose pyrophosphatase [Gammaproteobacteria bacterium]|nr:MAG: ADP-ribose pyrophosphatase [Gammaproteobacteria bacterium]
MSVTYHYDYAVFIGRFQPFHIGHLFVFQEALKRADHLLVLIGSADTARSLRNPFTFTERQTMIKQSLPKELAGRITLLPLPDCLYDDKKWMNSVMTLVKNTVNDTAARVALVGHDKDETTYYLKLFPRWASVQVGNLDGINATAVRNHYLTHPSPSRFDSDILLPETLYWLHQFSHSEAFAALVEEYRVVECFKSDWQNTPYPVIFTTTDALIRYRNEILLITRKHHPGKDLLALPGGFLDREESLFDGCLRELSEETRLNVKKNTLKKHLLKQQVFDAPKRSSRGRVITHCYYFDLSPLPEKPAAQADDDAKALAWYNIDDLQRNCFFEDHFFIIQYLLNNI